MLLSVCIALLSQKNANAGVLRSRYRSPRAPAPYSDEIPIVRREFNTEDGTYSFGFKLKDQRREESRDSEGEVKIIIIWPYHTGSLCQGRIKLGCRRLLGPPYHIKILT